MGAGLYFYFYFLKYFSYVFFVLFILSTVHVITNYKGNGSLYQDKTL